MLFPALSGAFLQITASRTNRFVKRRLPESILERGTFPSSQKKKPAEVSAGFPLVSFMAGRELALSPAFRHETVILFVFAGNAAISSWAWRGSRGLRHRGPPP